MEPNEFFEKLQVLSSPNQEDVDKLRKNVIFDPNFPSLVLQFINNQILPDIPEKKIKSFKIWCSKALSQNSYNIVRNNSDLLDIVLDFLLNTTYDIKRSVESIEIITSKIECLDFTRNIYMNNKDDPLTLARYIYSLSSCTDVRTANSDLVGELISTICSINMSMYIDQLPEHDIYRSYSKSFLVMTNYTDPQKMIISLVNDNLFDMLWGIVEGIQNMMEQDITLPSEYYKFITEAFKLLYRMQIFLTKIKVDETVPFNLVSDSLEAFQDKVCQILENFICLPELCFNAINAVFTKGVFNEAEDFITYVLLYLMVDFKEIPEDYIEVLLEIVYSTIASVKFEDEISNPEQFYGDYLTFKVITKKSITSDIILSSCSARQVAAVVFYLIFVNHNSLAFDWIQSKDITEAMAFLIFVLYSASKYIVREMESVDEIFDDLDLIASDICEAEGDTFFSISQLNLIAAISVRGQISEAIKDELSVMREDNILYPVLYTLLCRQIMAADEEDALQFLQENNLLGFIISNLDIALSDEPLDVVREYAGKVETDSALIQQLIERNFNEANAIIDRGMELKDQERLDSLFKFISYLITVVEYDFDSVVENILTMSSTSDPGCLIEIGNSLFVQQISHPAYVHLIISMLDNVCLNSFMYDILIDMINAIGTKKDILVEEIDGVPIGLILYKAFGEHIINSHKRDIENVDLESVLMVMIAVAFRQGPLDAELITLAENTIQKLLSFENIEEAMEDIDDKLTSVIVVPLAILMHIALNIELPPIVPELTIFLAQQRLMKPESRQIFAAQLLSIGRSCLEEGAREDAEELFGIASELMDKTNVNFELNDWEFGVYMESRMPPLKNIAPGFINYVKNLSKGLNIKIYQNDEEEEKGEEEEEKGDEEE